MVTALSVIAELVIFVKGSVPISLYSIFIIFSYLALQGIPEEFTIGVSAKATYM